MDKKEWQNYFANYAAETDVMDGDYVQINQTEAAELAEILKEDNNAE